MWASVLQQMAFERRLLALTRSSGLCVTAGRLFFEAALKTKGPRRGYQGTFALERVTRIDRGWRANGESSHG